MPRRFPRAGASFARRTALSCTDCCAGNTPGPCVLR